MLRQKMRKHIVIDAKMCGGNKYRDCTGLVFYYFTHYNLDYYTLHKFLQYHLLKPILTSEGILESYVPFEQLRIEYVNTKHKTFNTITLDFVNNCDDAGNSYLLDSELLLL